MTVTTGRTTPAVADYTAALGSHPDQLSWTTVGLRLTSEDGVGERGITRAVCHCLRGIWRVTTLERKAPVGSLGELAVDKQPRTHMPASDRESAKWTARRPALSPTRLSFGPGRSAVGQALWQRSPRGSLPARPRLHITSEGSGRYGLPADSIGGDPAASV
jgi:hypothetical protein